MSFWKLTALTFVWGLVGLASGCGGSGPEITGTVTLDGKPLSGARVDFEPYNAPPGVGGNVAFCDENGAFTLIPQAEGRTLEPAAYGVIVSRKTDPQGNVPSSEDYGQLDAAGQLKETLPAKYTSRKLDGSYEIVIEIKEGSVPPLKIELKSE